MDTAAATAPVATSPPRISPAVLVTLSGSFLASLTAQFASANLVDIQGSVGASADEASWIGTVYTVASAVGIVVSPVLTRALGVRRYFLASAAVFAFAAWMCTLVSSLAWMLPARALQGVAAGGFGPIAFAAVFVMCKGARLSKGLALLAFSLVVSVNAGPALAGPIEAALGWRGLFLVQFLVAGALILAGRKWLAHSPFDRSALKTDWMAFGLLAIAAGAVLLAVNQGTRRFWLDDPVVAWSLCVAIGASVGFAAVYRWSPVRIFDLRKMLDPRFGLPITLNLVFRTSFAITVYLIPLLLAFTLGYRPLEISRALWWVLVPQVLAFPLATRWMRGVDSRIVSFAGLLLCGIGVALAAFSSNLVGAEQLRASLVLIGVGQMLFLVATLWMGAGPLKPADGPLASIAFNLTTVGGTTIGVGLISHFVTERAKWHSNALVEHVTTGNPAQGLRVQALTDAWGTRVGDDALATARAILQVAAGVRREAWLLAINDAFALMAVVLVVAAVGTALMPPSPPIPRPPQGDVP